MYKYYRLESKSGSSVIEVVCDGNTLSFDVVDLSDKERTITMIVNHSYNKHNYEQLLTPLDMIQPINHCFSFPQNSHHRLAS